MFSECTALVQTSPVTCRRGSQLKVLANGSVIQHVSLTLHHGADGGVKVTHTDCHTGSCTTALTRSSIASNTHGFDRKPVIETLVDTRFGMAQS